MELDLTLSTLAPLTAAERHDLLFLARRSIRASLLGEAPPAIARLTPTLCAPGAAFVSLHHERRLRGCVGTVVADRALHDTIAHMARSAAFEDPRFSPLTALELTAAEIEISRLSPLVRALPQQICPGAHGVCLISGEHRAVFLPQVAWLYGWDRETLLQELCCKAMLPPDAWRRPESTLMAFTTEIFGDGDTAEREADD